MNRPEISPRLADLLQHQRESINSRVQSLLRSGAKWDPNELLEHICVSLSPVIDAIHQVLPERVAYAFGELLDVSIELFQAHQLGSLSRSRRMAWMWRTLFPELARYLGRDPKRVAGSLCNGLYFLESHGEQRAEQWLERLRTFGPLASDPDQLLAIGKFAAWLSGLAAYRSSALKAARSLPAEAVGKMLGLKGNHEIQVVAQLAAWQDNPWAIGGDLQDMPRTSRIPPALLMVCCDFRGFGGNLLAPPTVCLRDGHFQLTDGYESWVLHADRFGWMTVRSLPPIEPSAVPFAPSVTPLEPLVGPSSRAPNVSPGGRLRWDGIEIQFESLVRPTSQAFDGRTLAVTTQTSFHVFLIAREAVSA